MVYSILKYSIFLICFVMSLWACSSIQFDKICKVHQPGKVILLLFLLSLSMAYLTSQAIFELTIYNGFGG